MGLFVKECVLICQKIYYKETNKTAHDALGLLQAKEWAIELQTM